MLFISSLKFDITARRSITRKNGRGRKSLKKSRYYRRMQHEVEQ
jgi:hypothetical protein